MRTVPSTRVVYTTDPPSPPRSGGSRCSTPFALSRARSSSRSRLGGSKRETRETNTERERRGGSVCVCVGGGILPSMINLNARARKSTPILNRLSALHEISGKTGLLATNHSPRAPEQSRGGRKRKIRRVVCIFGKLMKALHDSWRHESIRCFAGYRGRRLGSRRDNDDISTHVGRALPRRCSNESCIQLESARRHHGSKSDSDETLNFKFHALARQEGEIYRVLRALRRLFWSFARIFVSLFAIPRAERQRWRLADEMSLNLPIMSRVAGRSCAKWSAMQDRSFEENPECYSRYFVDFYLTPPHR